MNTERYDCDRCGKLYQKDNSGYFTLTQFGIGSYEYRSTHIQLCPECMNELIEWLELDESEENALS